MRRKLDLSDLTDDEAEHLIQVVQRDFSLRKKEEDRLNEMKQKLDEEGNKCSILSKHERFNDHCCMCCCSPFNFLINTKRQCQDCKYNICKNCSFYQKKEKAWLCNMCQQARGCHKEEGLKLFSKASEGRTRSQVETNQGEKQPRTKEKFPDS